jgi:hypothetical protein
MLENSNANTSQQYIKIPFKLPDYSCISIIFT